MPRQFLAIADIHPAIQGVIAAYQHAVVHEVQLALAAHAVVVVGMATNPFCKKARALLNKAGVAHHYLEYGGYLSRWRERSALKMWTGWPTLPMVFVRGTLVGGANDLQKLIESGELAPLLVN